MPISTENDPAAECIICLNLKMDAPQWQLERCGHTFCHTCLQSTLSANPAATCPLCRAGILDATAILGRPGTSRAPPPSTNRLQAPPRSRSSTSQYDLPTHLGHQQRYSSHQSPQPLRTPHELNQSQDFPYDSNDSINTCLYAARNNIHPDPAVRRMLRDVGQAMLDMDPRDQPTPAARRRIFRTICEDPPGTYTFEGVPFTVVVRSNNTMGRSSRPGTGALPASGVSGTVRTRNYNPLLVRTHGLPGAASLQATQRDLPGSRRNSHIEIIDREDRPSSQTTRGAVPPRQSQRGPSHATHSGSGTNTNRESYRDNNAELQRVLEMSRRDTAADLLSREMRNMRIATERSRAAGGYSENLERAMNESAREWRQSRATGGNGRDTRAGPSRSGPGAEDSRRRGAGR